MLVSKGLIRNIKKDKEDKEAYADRVRLSHGHDARHCREYLLENPKLISLKMFLAKYPDPWQDPKKLESIQVYVHQISLQRFENYKNIDKFHPKNKEINIYVIIPNYLRFIIEL